MKIEIDVTEKEHSNLITTITQMSVRDNKLYGWSDGIMTLLRKLANEYKKAH